ncbi:hypothetical protein K488DRAFT_81599 [Vararia minispora EC-137]|uniref:Uncharacterized protein n=1 Tax=Vararia minispora EC-137 TaxID=1314806 RepID=A0ACB8QYG2_9AGAM|nr:hypothetical protein K488DRAFT_81599 [Vararia minispora EC-137]
MAVPRPANDNTFTSHLLRTSTPAPDEKVLMYLETMRAAEGPDGETILSPKSRLSALPRSQISGASFNRNGNGGYAGEGGGEDVLSDVQEQSQSTLGSLVHHEPAPEDEPGPHYASYGSSWGNFGPMSPDSALEGSQSKAAGVPLPNSTIAQSTTKVRSSRAGSRASASQKAPSAMSKARVTEKDVGSMLDEVSKSPKAKSQMTGIPNGGNRPTSPRSRMSHDQSPHSRLTRSEKPPTVYPPLPESHSGSNLGSVSQAKSRRAHSRAPSLSPSDSPSNYKPPRPQQKPKEPTLPPLPSVSGSEIEGASKARSHQNGDARAPPGPSVLSASRSQRPFSPYRNAPTNQDLLHAAVMDGRPSLNGSVQGSRRGGNATISASGFQSPEEMDDDEQEMIREILRRGGPATNRTSYAATSVLEPTHVSHFHDMDLCILLHQLDDPMAHEVVKKAVKKAVKTRVKQLGLKYDNEACTIKEYRKSFHNHDPSVHLQPNYQPSVPLPQAQTQPEWVQALMQQMEGLQQQVAVLGPKLDGLLAAPSSNASQKYYPHGESEMAYAQTPATQTIHIATNPTGTVGEGSMYQPGTEMMIGSREHALHRDDDEEEDDEDDEEGTETGRRTVQGMGSTQGDTHTRGISDYTVGHRNSPGQQYLEEELYKLRIRPGDSHSAVTHKTWELARDDGEEYEEEEGDAQAAITESGMPEIPDSQGGYTRPTSPPAPSEGGRHVAPVGDGQVWAGQGAASDYNSEPLAPPPWQRIHQRLLNWAIVWPLSELDNALNSTTRGSQVDEVALSIWSTQTYKRYVRSKMTDSPPGRVDRLFVPPNMADAISNAVFNGRHGDAAGMLRELWHPFGLEGMPRLLVVLAKHRTDANHWVVHRFSLPDGTLTTYDSYPERCLPDGRSPSPTDDQLANPIWSQPLGWWFAIRLAWPNAIYPSPDNLMQKMVRLHRPMQLGIDNSVAAAGIWRNLLMGSRAERNLDLARLRDLINTETANLRQRKLMGKLTIGGPRANWEDLN